MTTNKANKSNWEIPTKPFEPDYNYRNNALNMDFYELRMAEGYFKLGLQDVKGIFDIFFRKNPAPKGKVSGYTIACGQEQLAKFLQDYHFDEHALNYLYYKGFDVEFIKYLSTYKWNGTMLAVPEGTICYPNEPVIRIECDVVGAFLIETYALQTFNLNSLIATKANRIVRAANGRDVMEFGGRRAQGENRGCTDPCGSGGSVSPVSALQMLLLLIMNFRDYFLISPNSGLRVSVWIAVTLLIKLKKLDV